MLLTLITLLITLKIMLLKCSAHTKTVLPHADKHMRPYKYFIFKKVGGEGEALGKHSKEI